MGFLSADVLDDGLCCGQPGRRGDFADVVVLLGTEEGAQLDREQVFAAVMAGERLHTDLIRPVFEGVDAYDLRGVEEGVDHGARFGGEGRVVVAMFALIFDEGLAMGPSMSTVNFA
jgi:hypothetical protein